MKEKIIEIITSLKDTGKNISEQLEKVSSSAELDELILEFDKWDEYTCDILNRAFVYPQLHNMFKGTSSLGNIYDDNTSFKAKRARLYELLPKKIHHLNTAIGVAQSANTKDLLPIEDVPSTFQSKLTTNTSIMKKLFVSHSSIDDIKIKPLIDLINLIGLPHNQIFYCSITGYGLAPGENIFDGLKKELSNDVFALFLLSKNFYESPICMCEMGAVWIKSHKQIQVLIPPMEFKDIDGVFPNSIGFKLNNKNNMNTLKEEIETFFGLPKMDYSRWEEKRDEYLDKVNTLLI
jgi:hypothetical protein